MSLGFNFAARITPSAALANHSPRRAFRWHSSATVPDIDAVRIRCWRERGYGNGWNATISTRTFDLRRVTSTNAASTPSAEVPDINPITFIVKPSFHLHSRGRAVRVCYANRSRAAGQADHAYNKLSTAALALT